MTKYFYSRVSSKGQNLDRQTKMSKELGIDPENVFEEKQSGKNMERAELQRMLALLKEGDELYVESFSRLSRSLSDLLDLCNTLNSKGVALVSLKEGECDTRTATGRLFFGITACFAQYEREIAAERRLEGQRIKRERTGRSGGRRKTDQGKLDTAIDLYLQKEMTCNEICGVVGISRARLYKEVKERGITRD